MPSVKRDGVVGKYVELPPELVEAVSDLAKLRGHTFRQEVTEALRRHVAHPPKDEPTPYTDPPKGKK